VVAYAREQSWLTTPAVAEAAPVAEQAKQPEPASAPVAQRTQPRRPTAQQPPVPKPNDVDDDEAPPDTYVPGVSR
jgi:hypothetical protein